MMEADHDVNPEVYNRDYFLSDSCEGFKEFNHNRGLSNLKSKLLKMLELRKEDLLLDIGCGRGEFLLNAAPHCKKAIGIDYSRDAVQISMEMVSETANAEALFSDCKHIPLRDNSFEKVVCGDVVEHLSFESGVKLFKEIHRVLKPGGLAIIHTSPNSIFIKFVLPLGKFLLRLINKEAEKKIGEKLHKAESVHVCIHNFFSLKKLLKMAGVTDARVVIDPDILRGGEYIHTQEFSKNPLIKILGMLGRIFIIRFFIGNDLYVKIYKKEKGEGL